MMKRVMMSFPHKEPINPWHTTLLVCLLLSLSIHSFLKASDRCRYSNVVFLLAATKTNFVEKTINNAESKISSTSWSDKHQENDDQQKERENMVCDFSQPRHNICEIAGFVIVRKNSTTIYYVSDGNLNSFQGEIKIKPYARKHDPNAMVSIKELSLKPLNIRPRQVTSHCTEYHPRPALIFSVGGYTGSYLHDYADVLIPLFTTSHQFFGEVQFVVTNSKLWWLNKYKPILRALSQYDVIDMDNSIDTHCFEGAIVGTTFHKELSVYPSKTPKGNYSIVEFREQLRKSFPLERETTVQFSGDQSLDERPRLLIISRRETRRFINEREIVGMAEELGYDVVIDDASVTTDILKFAELVNSCDVMMGVHGAGLVNMFFLPAGAVLIQLLPFGGIDGYCRQTYGEVAMDLKLKYLEYKVEADETTLIEQYPSDHPVLTNPLSIHEKGWEAIKSVFLDKQNLRPHLDKLRSTLLEALDYLKSIKTSAPLRCRMDDYLCIEHIMSDSSTS